MPKVIFKLDKPNNNKTVIMMVSRYSSRKFILSTGISIAPRNWNNEKQQAKVTGTALEQQEAMTINKRLAKCNLSFLTAYDYFISNNIIPTVTQLKERYFDQMGGKTTNEKNTNLLAYISNLIDETGNTETTKAYIKVRNLLKKTPKSMQLEFQDLNIKKLRSITDNWTYLTSEETGNLYTRSYLNKIASTLGSILKKAKLEGYPVPTDYEKGQWKPTKPNNEFMGNDCVLNKKEIEIMENAELNPRFDKIRDLFLIGYYTGQRFSDFIRLTKENIVHYSDGEYLQFVQKKTNKKVPVPFTKKLKCIFEKYDGFPPKISSQKFNDAIKELCEHLGFNTLIVKYRVEGNSEKPKEVKVPKYKLVSSHTCRRSFCTNHALDRVPSHIIMRISGHKDIRTLSQYVRFNVENPTSGEILRHYFE
jgi:integrase